MHETTLERARAGDDRAFAALTDPYRRELRVHCYRLLGSAQDAEDLVQETLLAAWRALAELRDGGSMRAWLYRIATNRCLNALRAAGRRPEGRTELPANAPAPTPAEPIWLQPFPDALLEGIPDQAPGPEARVEAKEAVGLAFVAGLQRMPPRQRAVLVLRDVLGYSAAEVAEMLEASAASVNGALVRARAALEATPEQRTRGSLPDSPARRRMLAHFADAVVAGDVGAMVALLTDDACIRMPPQPIEYRGRAAAAEFLHSRHGLHTPAGNRLIAVGANGQPAFAHYVRDGQADVLHASGFLVLDLREDGICAITRFADGGALPYFGLPRTMPASASHPPRSAL